ncbi:df7e4d12-3738-4a76-8f33-5d0e6f7c9ca7 [Thermothielavioides terrestris]|uniref:Glycosyltransferase family 8 protein n=2 Tax=Thermothielavioides terrestris TaxID=2587410 RepID=G2QTF8_THETT|nr:glycosyltransferase family 8 protein [Thermothielavioides terrestris NRRL 8126]AEO63575.1 glycosyltransferase family 8 protein [Thermothielavioides terrestris NRRL 8126]SPQ20934.1 df7e4d12-3738-4a76-8f33-5d0e6f7c9ca7 [Thermothielavioides terrestris]
MLIQEKVVDSDKIWACLLTNESYLPGLLALAFSLRAARSRYPLVALYTASLGADALAALRARHIPVQRVPELRPSANATEEGEEEGEEEEENPYPHSPRFLHAFTKLAAFALVAYARVVLLDADMLVRRNMDELLEDVPPLLPPQLDAGDDDGGGGTSARAGAGPGPVFGAAHACLCNPLRIKGYPPEWTREGCVYTTDAGAGVGAGDVGEEVEGSGHGRQQHQEIGQGALGTGGSSDSNSSNSALHTTVADETNTAHEKKQAAKREKPGAACLNGGLIVLQPGRGGAWAEIEAFLRSGQATAARLPFADQSLLGEVFRGRWAALPWVYNGLKTLRWEGVHADMWSDDEVKNVHYILTPKPWELQGDEATLDAPERWWWEVDSKRRRWEAERGLDWNVVEW